ETTAFLKKNWGEWFTNSPKENGKYVADPRKWPDPVFGPGVKGTTMFVHNELTTSASPAKVFDVLRNAGDWSKVSDNLSDAKIEGGGKSLKPGSKFNWTTFGSNMNAEVLELDTKSSPMVFGFRGKDRQTDGKEIDVYHRYLLYPAPGGGTRIVTEESERGLLTRLNPNQEKMLHAGHQYLLDGIAKAATAAKATAWR